MKKIYIAGPYGAPDVMSVFENMRKGMSLATKVRQWGFAPFCPWMDYQYFFMNHAEPFTLENCYEYSMAWLEVSDAVLLVKRWSNSHGARKEVDRAWELHIPVFESFHALLQWDEDPLSLSDGKKPSHKTK